MGSQLKIVCAYSLEEQRGKNGEKRKSRKPQMIRQTNHGKGSFERESVCVF